MNKIMEYVLDTNVRNQYIQKCLKKIMPEFPIGIYTDSESIEKSCKLCVDFFISEFEIECKKINSTADVSFFMSAYSELSSNKEAYSNNDYIIFRKLCNFFWGELTKLNITNSVTFNVDSPLMSNLYYLTELINQYTQYLYTYYIVNKKHFQLEVYQDNFGITVTDNELAKKINYFPNQFDQSIYKTTCVDNSEIINFRDITELAFNETARLFFDKTFPPNNSSLNIDFSQISFSNFKNILDTSYIVNDIEPTEILVLTDLIKNGANDFYQGLILRPDNVVLKQSVEKPHIMYRSRFRPILEVKVDYEIVYISTPYMIFEALAELISNQIPFAILPKEWESNEIMKEYAKKQKEEHDKWLEGAVETVLLENEFKYLRNKKSINTINLLREPTSKTGRFVGEIDFIVLDEIHKIVSVVECKFMKTKYHYPTFAADKQAFTEGNKCYENQLTYKLDWVNSHLLDIQKEFKLNFDISDYKTEAYFITNSFVFYSLFSKYPIVAIQDLKKYLGRDV